MPCPGCVYVQCTQRSSTGVTTITIATRGLRNDTYPPTHPTVVMGATHTIAATRDIDADAIVTNVLGHKEWDWAPTSVVVAPMVFPPAWRFSQGPPLVTVYSRPERPDTVDITLSVCVPLSTKPFPSVTRTDLRFHVDTEELAEFVSHVHTLARRRAAGGVADPAVAEVHLLADDDQQLHNARASAGFTPTSLVVEVAPPWSEVFPDATRTSDTRAKAEAVDTDGIDTAERHEIGHTQQLLRIRVCTKEDGTGVAHSLFTEAMSVQGPCQTLAQSLANLAATARGGGETRPKVLLLTPAELLDVVWVMGTDNHVPYPVQIADFVNPLSWLDFRERPGVLADILRQPVPSIDPPIFVACTPPGTDENDLRVLVGLTPQVSELVSVADPWFMLHAVDMPLQVNAELPRVLPWAITVRVFTDPTDGHGAGSQRVMPWPSIATVPTPGFTAKPATLSIDISPGFDRPLIYSDPLPIADPYDTYGTDDDDSGGVVTPHPWHVAELQVLVNTAQYRAHLPGSCGDATISPTGCRPGGWRVVPPAGLVIDLLQPLGEVLVLFRWAVRDFVVAVGSVSAPHRLHFRQEHD